eukprot:gb/GEZJ01001268.1/.p1 GENE.gb/GEZJ01001268.1/~~gb/GEZJ01001268.1/.p1  ORF type:complete len:143 (+),score=6.16 gb/GEZJ01001268.1/:2706-3134(+)
MKDIMYDAYVAAVLTLCDHATWPAAKVKGGNCLGGKHKCRYNTRYCGGVEEGDSVACKCSRQGYTSNLTCVTVALVYVRQSENRCLALNGRAEYEVRMTMTANDVSGTDQARPQSCYDRADHGSDAADQVLRCWCTCKEGDV